MVRNEADPAVEVRAAWARIRPDVDTSAVDIVFRVLRAARLLEQTSDHYLARYELRRPELELLMLLRRTDGPLSPTGIAESLLFSAPATTKRIAALEARDYLARTPDPSDRRRVLVSLTAAGRDLVDRVFPDHAAFDVDLLSALSDAQRDRIADGLTTLVAELTRRASIAP